MKTLLTEEQLSQGVARMAAEIHDCYVDRPLTIVGVLIGSVVLMADLIRRLDIPLRVGMVQARSYQGTQPGPLEVNTDMLSSVAGRDVLLVDDIFDTGNTLSELVPRIEDLGPTSVKTAVLLRKEGRCKTAMQPDFVGFDIPDKFVVGYGLDYRDAYRNLRHVAVLEESEMLQDSDMNDNTNQQEQGR